MFLLCHLNCTGKIESKDNHPWPLWCIFPVKEVSHLHLTPTGKRNVSSIKGSITENISHTSRQLPYPGIAQTQN